MKGYGFIINSDTNHMLRFQIYEKYYVNAQKTEKSLNIYKLNCLKYAFIEFQSPLHIRMRIRFV